MKDLFGVEVRPGDIISYSVAGSLQVGIVRETGYSLYVTGSSQSSGSFRIKVCEFNTDDKGKVWLWNSWLRRNRFLIIDRSSLPTAYEKELKKNGY